MDVLRRNAKLTADLCGKVPGLKATEADGAMYAMIGIDVDELDSDIKDDAEFAKLLLKEENVFVLPGKVYSVVYYTYDRYYYYIFY